jgi:hypothetical protein
MYLEDVSPHINLNFLPALCDATVAHTFASSYGRQFVITECRK